MLLGLHQRERAGFQMARNGRGYNAPGRLVRLDKPVRPSQLIPNGQPQQVSWERYGIPTSLNSKAQYAIHRAVLYAYETGYKDAQKHREHYHGFQQALDKADQEEFNELKDRLVYESKGEMTNSRAAGLTASLIRELLQDAGGSSQRDQSGYKEGDHMRRDKSRTCGHHPQNPCRNQENYLKRPEGVHKCGHWYSADSSPFESDEERNYVYR